MEIFEIFDYSKQNFSSHARLATPTLPTARSSAAPTDAHRHVRTFSCFAFFPTDFREKERLLAV